MGERGFFFRPKPVLFGGGFRLRLALVLALFSPIISICYVKNARADRPHSVREPFGYLRVLERTLGSLEEVKVLRKHAFRLNQRVWFTGESAIAIAFRAEAHHSEIKSGRTTLSSLPLSGEYLIDLLPPSESIEVVVEGNQDDLDILRRQALLKFPNHHWVFHILRRPDKGGPIYEKTFPDSDNFKTHQDSLSTSLIEISNQNDIYTQAYAIDLHQDWRTIRGLIHSVEESKAEFYPAASHAAATPDELYRYPESIPVLRFLSHAFAHELEIDRQSEKEIIQIIQRAPELDARRFFRFQSPDQAVVAEATKLFQQARNFNRLWPYLEKIGLKEKLRNHSPQLAAWLNREPLPSFQIGLGNGATAGELNLDHLFHETKTREVREIIANSPAHAPRLLMSRADAPDERASFGDGVYFTPGEAHYPETMGVFRTGYTVAMRLSPNAREGTDFERGVDTLGQPFILLKNQAAVTLAPLDEWTQALVNNPRKFLQEIFSWARFAYNQRAEFQAARRRLDSYWHALTEREKKEFLSSIGRIEFPTDQGHRIAKLTYLPRELAEKLIPRMTRWKLPGQLKRSKNYARPNATFACEDAVGIAEFLLRDAKTPAEILEILDLPPDHICGPFFSTLWLENADRFVDGRPSAEQFVKARQMAGGFDASLKLLRVMLEESSAFHYDWSPQDRVRAVQPIWNAPHDDPYRLGLRKIWLDEFAYLFIKNRGDLGTPVRKVLQYMFEARELPFGDLLEIFMDEFNPNRATVIDFHQDVWTYRGTLAAEFVAQNFSTPQLAEPLESLFRTFEKRNPYEWDPKTILSFRRAFGKSRFATTFFLNRFLNQINFRSEEHLKAMLDETIRPPDAPEWDRELSAFKRKAETLRGSPCNAALL